MSVFYLRLTRPSRCGGSVNRCVWRCSLLLVFAVVISRPVPAQTPGPAAPRPSEPPPLAPGVPVSPAEPRSPAAPAEGTVAPPPASPNPPPGVLTRGVLGSSLEQRLARLQQPDLAPCKVHGSLQLGSRTYVACGPGGLWIVELDDVGGDRLLARQQLDGSAVGVFERGGQAWVELQVLSARPVHDSGAGTLVDGGRVVRSTLAPLPALTPDDTRRKTAPPARAPLEMAVEGRVLSSAGGRVVVDLGREHGVKIGTRMEFNVREEEESPLGTFQRWEVVAVGRVSSVTDAQSLIELGVAEEVPLTAKATVSSRALTSNRSSPPRVPGIWTLAGVVRPFFVLEQLGLGALNELSVSYQSMGPLRAQLQLAPVAFASAGEGSTFAGLAIGLLSFDTRLFEIGFGMGIQTINDGDFEPGSGLTIAQSLRFGARDGLSLSLRNDVSLFHSEFEYSAFSAEAQVPVADKGWLVMEGGGGTVGYAFFEVGGKVLVTGNGTRDSLFLRGTIGYAALYETRFVTEVFNGNGFFSGSDELYYGGPLIGLGVEWRK